MFLQSFKARAVAGSSNVSSVRLFSTSPVCERLYTHITSRRQKVVPEIVGGMSSKDLPKQIPEFPAYPYGPSQWFKQSDRGLYGGQTIQFGNQISEFRNKSRRSWLPNVVRSALWSEVLNMDIRIKVTTSVLRTITKEGGIDNYLTKSTAARIKELGPTGWKLRYRVLQKLEAQEKTAPKVLETVKIDGNDVPVYFKHISTSSGQQLNIKVGKRKILKELFGALKQNGQTTSHAEFSKSFSKKPVEVLLETLEANNYNLAKLSA